MQVSIKKQNNASIFEKGTILKKENHASIYKKENNASIFEKENHL